MNNKTQLKTGHFKNYEIEYLLKNHKTKTYKEICKELQRSSQSVFSKMYRLNIKAKKSSYITGEERGKTESLTSATEKQLDLKWKQMIYYANNILPGNNFKSMVEVFKVIDKKQFINNFKNR